MPANMKEEEEETKLDLSAVLAPNSSASLDSELLAMVVRLPDLQDISEEMQRCSEDIPACRSLLLPRRAKLSGSPDDHSQPTASYSSANSSTGMLLEKSGFRHEEEDLRIKRECSTETTTGDSQQQQQSAVEWTLAELPSGGMERLVHDGYIDWDAITRVQHLTAIINEQLQAERTQQSLMDFELRQAQHLRIRIEREQGNLITKEAEIGGVLWTAAVREGHARRTLDTSSEQCEKAKLALRAVERENLLSATVWFSEVTWQSVTSPKQANAPRWSRRLVEVSATELTVQHRSRRTIALHEVTGVVVHPPPPQRPAADEESRSGLMGYMMSVMTNNNNKSSSSRLRVETHEGRETIQLFVGHDRSMLLSVDDPQPWEHLMRAFDFLLGTDLGSTHQPSGARSRAISSGSCVTLRTVDQQRARAAGEQLGSTSRRRRSSTTASEVSAATRSIDATLRSRVDALSDHRNELERCKENRRAAERAVIRAVEKREYLMQVLTGLSRLQRLSQDPPLTAQAERHQVQKCATLSSVGRALTQPQQQQQHGDDSGADQLERITASQPPPINHQRSGGGRAMSTTTPSGMLAAELGLLTPLQQKPADTTTTRSRRSHTLAQPQPHHLLLENSVRQQRASSSSSSIVRAYDSQRRQIHGRYLSMVVPGEQQQQQQPQADQQLTQQLARCALLYEFVSTSGGGEDDEGSTVTPRQSHCCGDTPPSLHPHLSLPSTSSSATHPPLLKHHRTRSTTAAAALPTSLGLAAEEEEDAHASKLLFVPITEWEPPKELAKEHARLIDLLEQWWQRNRAAGSALRNLAKAKSLRKHFEAELRDYQCAHNVSLTVVDTTNDDEGGEAMAFHDAVSIPSPSHHHQFSSVLLDEASSPSSAGGMLLSPPCQLQRSLSRRTLSSVDDTASVGTVGTMVDVDF